MTLMLCLAAVAHAATLEVPDSVKSLDPAAGIRHQRIPVTLPPGDLDDKSKTVDEPAVQVVNVAGDTLLLAAADTAGIAAEAEVINLTDSTAVVALGKKREFNPDPTTALWMSALCPGLGQIYNRRYWKLPIVVGAFVGLAYGTSWNNRMLHDYSKAYRDAMDDDPETRSYMDFYPSTVQESDLDMTWLQSALKNKKDYYRRYRDICILCMVGVYALSIIDAYVDASLAHFDISPDLSMTVAPTLLDTQYSAERAKPKVGLSCAFTF